MVNINNIKINSFFFSKNIIVLDRSFSHKQDRSNSEILGQVDLIIEFHKYLSGYKDNVIPRIVAYIGRDIENYKKQLVILENSLKNITSTDMRNSSEDIILNYGPELLKRGKLSIEYIMKNNYKELIERSMNGFEVCLGRVDESNLRKGHDNKLEVGTLKYLAYNLKEQDLYSYIKRIKRKQPNIDIEYIINVYVDELMLEGSSVEYLKGLSSYPVESLRTWQKYINGKFIDDSTFSNDFKKAIKIDGKSMIS